MPGFEGLPPLPTRRVRSEPIDEFDRRRPSVEAAPQPADQSPLDPSTAAPADDGPPVIEAPTSRTDDILDEPIRLDLARPDALQPVETRLDPTAEPPIGAVAEESAGPPLTTEAPLTDPAPTLEAPLTDPAPTLEAPPTDPAPTLEAPPNDPAPTLEAPLTDPATLEAPLTDPAPTLAQESATDAATLAQESATDEAYDRPTETAEAAPEMAAWFDLPWAADVLEVPITADGTVETQPASPADPPQDTPVDHTPDNHRDPVVGDGLPGDSPGEETVRHPEPTETALDEPAEPPVSTDELTGPDITLDHQTGPQPDELDTTADHPTEPLPPETDIIATDAELPDAAGVDAGFAEDDLVPTEDTGSPTLIGRLAQLGVTARPDVDERGQDHAGEPLSFTTPDEPLPIWQGPVLDTAPPPPTSAPPSVEPPAPFDLAPPSVEPPAEAPVMSSLAPPPSTPPPPPPSTPPSTPPVVSIPEPLPEMPLGRARDAFPPLDLSSLDGPSPRAEIRGSNGEAGLVPVDDDLEALEGFYASLYPGDQQTEGRPPASPDKTSGHQGRTPRWMRWGSRIGGRRQRSADSDTSSDAVVCPNCGAPARVDILDRNRGIRHLSCDSCFKMWQEVLPPRQ